MTLRLYTREQFEAELQKVGALKPTDICNGTTQIWSTSEGRIVSVPTLLDGEK